MSELRRIPLRHAVAAVAATAWLAAAIVVAPAPEPLRVVGGLALALALPGWLLTYAVLPPAFEEARLRLVLAFGLSLVATITIGIVLALATGKVDRSAVALSLAVLSTVIAAAAFLRVGTDKAVVAPRLRRPGTRVWVAAGVGAALAVLLVVLAVELFSMNTEAARFTALSLITRKGRPLALVENHEGGPRSYRWVVRRPNGVRLASGSLKLADGESGRFRVRSPVGSRVRVELFLDGGSKPYRSVTLVR